MRTIRRIFVCADDFGVSSSASLAILHLAEIHAISAIGVLVDGTCTAAHAGVVRAMSPDIAVGLHLNLTDDTPERPSGAQALRLLRACLGGALDRTKLRAEIRRQCARFEQLFERPPDFIDGHEHAHQLPFIRDALLSVAPLHCGERLAVRSTRPGAWRGVKAAVIGGLGGGSLARALRRRGICANEDFAGVYDFGARVPYARRMQQWLERLSDRGLIMCHPQLPGAAPPAGGREAEFAYLASAAWRELQQQQNVQLVPFRA